jgi:hypothetical protein
VQPFVKKLAADAEEARFKQQVVFCAFVLCLESTLSLPVLQISILQYEISYA